MKRGYKKRPEFVPLEYRHAFDAVSKQHLADLVWSLAGRLAERSADELADTFARACEESARVSFERHDIGLGKADERFRARHARDEAKQVGPHEEWS